MEVMYAVVQEGLRPTIPEGTPLPLALLIRECVTTEPSVRPTFTEICSRLKRMRDL